MKSPFAYLCTICRWPLPEGETRKFHYFRAKKAALRFADRVNANVRIEYLSEGATLLKPVSDVVLEYDGQLFDCRQEFPYETTRDEVEEAWSDKESLGCDCERSDVIMRNCDEGFEKLGCGETIRRLSTSVVWESDSEDFMLH